MSNRRSLSIGGCESREMGHGARPLRFMWTTVTSHKGAPNGRTCTSSVASHSHEVDGQSPLIKCRLDDGSSLGTFQMGDGNLPLHCFLKNQRPWGLSESSESQALINDIQQLLINKEGAQTQNDQNEYPLNCPAAALV